MDLFTEYEKIIRLIEGKAAPLFEQYHARLQCKKGCDMCCMDGFKIRYIECAYLLQGIQQVSTETLYQILLNLKDTSPDKKCPLLVDHACSVYEYRPILCRLWGIVLKTREHYVSCPLNFGDVSSEEYIDYFDLDQYDEVLDKISQVLWQNLPPEQRTSEKAVRYSIREYLKQIFQTPEQTESPLS